MKKSRAAAKRAIGRILAERILILDGATGTELQKRGLPAGVCPEAWCLDHPRATGEIHRTYRQAGADIVFTCTFGANRLKLETYGIAGVLEINRDLARLAREAAGPGVFVFGDIGPTGRFVEPFGPLGFEEAVAAFRGQVRGLLEGGVDGFAIETMMDIQEARAALLAVREESDAFTIVTMTYESDGRTLGGTDPLTALVTLQSLGADAVGCNCSVGPEAMAEMIRAMKPYARVPLVAKPNAGLPRLVLGRTVFDMSPEAFAGAAATMAEAGGNLLGGCCGTTPDHIRALALAVGDRKPLAPLRRPPAVLSSARGCRVLGDGPLLIVGERINPTGKKALQEELRVGRMETVRRMAREQEEAGADLLDVNVGVPDIDEAKTIREVIGSVVNVTPLPLVIDSARVETIEAALRLYPGRALINSISGERDKLERLLPVAARYGAMFILLPLRGREVPETFAERREIVREVLRESRRWGFTREDVVVDALVMTAASRPAAPGETLKTVAWCARSLRCRTIVGLSNVSFGLPERRWINGAFLNMAQALGLTMAIANPAQEELMSLKLAGDVLLAKDRNASAYVRRFSAARKEPEPAAAADPARRVAEAILEGDRDAVIARVEEALAAGIGVVRLVEDTMIPAVVRVGDLYEQKRYFLPQLIAGAEAMQRAMEHLEPRLRGDAARAARGSVLLATVEGDIHDIGKNIVSLLLRNAGWQVVDLGKDVPAQRIVAAMEDARPSAVGLSALMTTTMVHMKQVIDLARGRGFRTPFLVGGAVVTREYAESIGAFYGRDGVEAVRVLEALPPEDA
jgi:5-methyltetrahydrofolate--homocysteine methyltransferase